jgi:hypothetical protein
MLGAMTGRRARIVLGVLVAAGTTACAGGPPTVEPSGVDGLVVPTPTPAPGDFVDGVDNPLLPLVPGRVLTYRATGEDGPQRITVRVTDRTWVVPGVYTVVVQARLPDARGRVVEDTYDWYAQDRAGNFWYLGEDTTAYDGGRPDTAGSWEAGVDGAEAGLAMPAHPRVGDGYAQEHLAGAAEDQAEVLALDETREVPAGTFGGLLQTEDTTPLEPGLVEWKFYARGLGIVEERDIAAGDEHVWVVSSNGPEGQRDVPIEEKSGARGGS